MRKKWIIGGVVALYLLVVLVMVTRSLTRFREKLGDPVEQVPVVQTTLPKSNPDALPDRVFVVHNEVMDEDTVVYQGTILARGQVRAVENAATGKVVGYAVAQLEDKGVWRNMLYHPNGEFWQDCGDLEVVMVLGDYFVGKVPDFGQYYLTKAPDDPEANRVQASVLRTGENRCAVWNIDGDFMGIQGFALLDGNGSVISRNQKRAEGNEAIRPGYLHSGFRAYVPMPEEPHRLMDLQTLETLPYVDALAINDGYVCFKDKNGLYTLEDAAGNAVFSDSENRCEYYSEAMQLLVDKNDRYHIFVGEEEPLGGRSYFAEDWAGGLYALASDASCLWLFDAEGKLVKTVEADPGCTLEMENAYGVLWINSGNAAWIRTPDGTETPLDTPEGALGLVDEKDSYCIYSHTEEVPCTYDLLQSDGTMVMDGFNSLSKTHVDGIFAARRGFTYGLVDKNGNWLWNERIFNANHEEGGYNHWDHWG